MFGKRQLNKLIRNEIDKNVYILQAAQVNTTEERSSEEDNVFEDEDFFINDKSNAREDLRDWFLKYRPSVESTSSLLIILKKIFARYTTKC